MNLAVGADERTHLVDTVLDALRTSGHDVTYLGPALGEERDWPEVSAAVARLVANDTVDQGIVMCWTGTGATMAANKVPGARAALCQDAETARGARVWNDANILGLSLRATSEAIAREILDAWFSTAPAQDEWNLRQIQRIRELEVHSANSPASR
ncbi:MAG: RpiB/LacA/LacB family sugar-phosphate isomerase [Chloroflexota bacterium]